ncbi:hypothetical protein [Collimonas fungivorans]|uniref:hypothetical protein n=1 Tax=Collimonas fungivorans TaxID=158899 RepID=UPI0012370E31|nr:hypothetical protein [Collimonas fungivorans]
MSKSLENRTAARITNNDGNSCPVAEAVRVVTASVLTNGYAGDISAELDGLASDGPAMMATLVHTGSISRLAPGIAGADSSSFPMTGAGLANIRNEL